MTYTQGLGLCGAVEKELRSLPMAFMMATSCLKRARFFICPWPFEAGSRRRDQLKEADGWRSTRPCLGHSLDRTNHTSLLVPWRECDAGWLEVCMRVQRQSEKHCSTEAATMATTAHISCSTKAKSGTVDSKRSTRHWKRNRRFLHRAFLPS